MSLKRNTLWNVAGMGLPLLGALLFIPPLLGHLGHEAFAVLALIWTLIGYFSLFDLGVGRALTVTLGRHAAQPQSAAARQALWAGLVLTALAGLAGAALMGLLAQPLAFDWLRLGTAWQQEAWLAFSIAALGVLPTTLTSALRGAMEGQGRFRASNLIRMVFGFLMFGLPLLATLVHGATLVWISIYLVLARWLFCFVAAWVLRRSLVWPESWRALGPQFPALFGFGFWLTVSGIVGPLMVYGDRFFVGALVGMEQLPYHAIPQELIMRLLILPTALCAALLPLYAAMHAEQIWSHYRRKRVQILALMAALGLAAALLTQPLLAWWLSPEFARTALPIALWMLAGVVVNALAMLPYTLLHACGQARITALFHLLQLPLYLALLYALVTWYGLVGAAAAWFVRAALDLLLLHLAAARLLHRGLHGAR